MKTFCSFTTIYENKRYSSDFASCMGISELIRVTLLTIQLTFGNYRKVFSINFYHQNAAVNCFYFLLNEWVVFIRNKRVRKAHTFIYSILISCYLNMTELDTFL